MSPLFLILLMIGTVLVVEQTMLFGFLFYGQLALYALALVGYSASKNGQHVPLASTCLYFVTMNWSFLRALVRWMGRSKVDTWVPTQGVDS